MIRAHGMNDPRYTAKETDEQQVIGEKGKGMSWKRWQQDAQDDLRMNVRRWDRYCTG